MKIFAWVKSLVADQPEPQLFNEYIPLSFLQGPARLNKKVIVQHKLNEEESSLSLRALEQRYPCPPYKEAMDEGMIS